MSARKLSLSLLFVGILLLPGYASGMDFFLRLLDLDKPLFHELIGNTYTDINRMGAAERRSTYKTSVTQLNDNPPTYQIKTADGFTKKITYLPGVTVIQVSTPNYYETHRFISLSEDTFIWEKSDPWGKAFERIIEVTKRENKLVLEAVVKESAGEPIIQLIAERDGSGKLTKEFHTYVRGLVTVEIVYDDKGKIREMIIYRQSPQEK